MKRQFIRHTITCNTIEYAQNTANRIRFTFSEICSRPKRCMKITDTKLVECGYSSQILFVRSYRLVL